MSGEAGQKPLSLDPRRTTFHKMAKHVVSGTTNINERSVDWGLYRYFLVVAETGSLTAAARRLGVSQPTVGRQIQALEDAMSARMFDRTSSGYMLTAAGKAVVELAQVIEAQAIAIERRVAGESERLDGRVRISAAEGLATYWLAPRLPQLRQRYPDIEVELIVGTDPLDLMRREADIVLRIGEPRSDDLVGRRMGQVHFGLFAAQSYLAAKGVPENLDALRDHVVIESIGKIADLAQVRRVRELTGAASTALFCDNVLTQFAALRAGMGLMALPLYMAQATPTLERLLSEEFDVALDLWLLVHRDLRPVARIGVVFEFLADAICRDRERLAGSLDLGLNRP
ncbi:MAG: LysR family transcriptional regulator [Alphaproteobacteria bacterium]|nr:LysR family transcriptional regulator [Alphaproteobacteria bacterium]